MKKKKLFYGPLGWVGSAGLIIGAGLLAFSFWFLSTTVLKDIGYVRTEATVVDFEERRDYIGGSYRHVYTEVVETKSTAQRTERIIHYIQTFRPIA